jgi:hypothetical protein
MAYGALVLIFKFASVYIRIEVYLSVAEHGSSY